MTIPSYIAPPYITPPYHLKERKGYDLYEGEFSDNWNPEPAYRAIFRASAKFYDGIIRKDLKVEEYVRRCNLVGQKFGLYHFMLPDTVKIQADTFIAVAKMVGFGHMPLTVDVEIVPSVYNISNLTWQKQVKEFMDRVEAVTGEACMIYTSRNYWDYVCVNGVPPVWTDMHPLWTAVYPRPVSIIDSVHEPYILPRGFSKWAVWQYEDSGRSYGYPNNDYDVFSDEYVAILDSKYGNSNQTVTFPSDIYIDNKDYRKVV